MDEMTETEAIEEDARVLLSGYLVGNLPIGWGHAANITALLRHNGFGIVRLLGSSEEEK